MATGGMSAAGGGGLTGPGSSATVKTKDGDSWSTTAARAGPDHGTSSSTERPLLWSEEAAAGHKARSSAGSGPTGHSWVGCDGEEHTKQTPSRRAIQHRRTLLRTVAERKATAQPDATCPRWRQRTQRRRGFSPGGERRPWPRPRPARPPARPSRPAAATGKAPSAPSLGEREEAAGGSNRSNERSQAQQSRNEGAASGARRGEPGIPR